MHSMPVRVLRRHAIQLDSQGASGWAKRLSKVAPGVRVLQGAMLAAALAIGGAGAARADNMPGSSINFSVSASDTATVEPGARRDRFIFSSPVMYCARFCPTTSHFRLAETSKSSRPRPPCCASPTADVSPCLHLPRAAPAPTPTPAAKAPQARTPPPTGGAAASSLSKPDDEAAVRPAWLQPLRRTSRAFAARPAHRTSQQLPSSARN